MKKKILYGIWAYFYLLCAFISNMENPQGAQAVALTVLSLIFFIPPGILLWDAWKASDRKTLRLLRHICILSLSLTLAAMIGNIAAVNASETVGNILYQVLIFTSVPMVCSQHYVLSLFLWACLLFCTFQGMFRKKNP